MALDVDTEDELNFFLRRKPKPLNQLKIGIRLFSTLGERVFQLIPEDQKIFLDLKLYDIPSTVEKAITNLQRFAIWMLTVHLSGGSAMLQAAQRAADKRVKILGITLLTSLSREDIDLVTPLSTDAVVLNLATLAARCGLFGVVCSPHEVKAIKTAFPQLACVCPGIRLDRGKDDQRRVASPSFALEAGADYLVVGRPLLQAIRENRLSTFEEQLYPIKFS